MTGRSRDSPLLWMTMLLTMANLADAFVFDSPNGLSLLSTSYSTSSHSFPTLHSSLQEAETNNAMKAYTGTTSTKKKQRKTKKKKTKQPPVSFQQPARGPGRALSQEELVAHVTQRHSKVDEKVANRGIFTCQAEQAKYIKHLNSRPALVLNADYQPLSLLPLSLWSWQDAVKAIFSGKVTVVDVYPDVTIRAASLEIPLPSVIALNEYVPKSRHTPAFTRRNVFLRDEYKCQYCRERFHTNDLSLDHVVPRCKGGVLSWTNAVTSCLKCNGRKGSMPVSQLRSIGMKLYREPRVPSHFDLYSQAGRMVPRRVDPTWKPYLGLFAAEEEEEGRSPVVGQDEEYDYASSGNEDDNS